DPARVGCSGVHPIGGTGLAGQSRRDGRPQGVHVERRSRLEDHEFQGVAGDGRRFEVEDVSVVRGEPIVCHGVSLWSRHVHDGFALLPDTVDCAVDALFADRARGAQLLGPQADAQLLELPCDFAYVVGVRPALRERRD
ncbi:MAG: hypothetical protein QOH27_4008, partial [Mycobacterium sp.]|nr:hypothetical protein [Mycobacterium sp.]